MDIGRSLWLRYGSKIYQGFAPLPSPTSHSLDFRNTDRDSSADGSHTLDRSAVSWRTDPGTKLWFTIHSFRPQVLPMLAALLPSFIFPRNKKPRKMFPTSYLDGLRGVAAFFVVVHHYTMAYTRESPTGYGLERGEPGSHDWFWLLPIVRVVHAGRFMVVIFFVISGYVLSYRSLKLARQGKHLELLDSLASSVFRRWIRLHLPVAASIIMAFMLGRLNLYHYMPKRWEHDPTGKTYLDQHPTPFPRPRGTFFNQTMDVFADIQNISDPFIFNVIRGSRYNVGVLWTIPIEFMGSMLVFVVVLGIARTKTWVKISVLCLLIYHAHGTARWTVATFLQGILLAEMSFIYSRPIESPSIAPSSDEEKKPRSLRSRSFAYKACFVFLFLLGIHLGGQPKDFWLETPGYHWMYTHLPPAYLASPPDKATFWPSIGGFLLIFSLEMAPFLQSIFTTSIAQYLGEISFSLYMIHCQIQFTLGEWLVPRMMHFTGGWSNGQSGFVAGIALSVAILGPLTFWVADVFSRLIDEKSVKFARWMSNKAFVKI